MTLPLTMFPSHQAVRKEVNLITCYFGLYVYMQGIFCSGLHFDLLHKFLNHLLNVADKYSNIHSYRLKMYLFFKKQNVL